MKIVLAEKVSPATLAVFKRGAGLADSHARSDHERLPANACRCRWPWSCVRQCRWMTQLLASAPKLRVIGRAGVGVDNIDADAATRARHRGDEYAGRQCRRRRRVDDWADARARAHAAARPTSTMHAGKWEKKSLQGTELRGKKFGILGLGRIGLEVARRARSFGMELIGHDPFVSAAVARENGIRLGYGRRAFPRIGLPDAARRTHAADRGHHQ